MSAQFFWNIHRIEFSGFGKLSNNTSRVQTITSWKFVGGNNRK
jgi:hypothetical protein